MNNMKKNTFLFEIIRFFIIYIMAALLPSFIIGTSEAKEINLQKWMIDDVSTNFITNPHSACAHTVGNNDPVANILREPAGRTLAKNYKKAAQYFQERLVPQHHFVDIGSAFTTISSLYPLKMSSELLSVYVHYRTIKRRLKPISLILAIQYYPSLKFLSKTNNRLALMVGGRYPNSSDLKRLYVDFLIGSSFDPNRFSKSDFPIEMRALLTHIIGSSSTPIRFYLQWGFPIQILNWLVSDPYSIQVGFTARLGLDFHL